MKAAYLQNHRIHVGEVPDPVPVKGQALVRTHSCGLCASDAHFLHLGDKVVEMSKKFGGPYSKLDLARVIVPGHEYVGEIIDYGPGSRRPLKIGTRVTSQPVVRTAGGHSIVGQSHDCPGGFGEYMLLDESVLMEIPAGLDDDMAAMTERCRWVWNTPVRASLRKMICRWWSAVARSASASSPASNSWGSARLPLPTSTQTGATSR